MSTATASPDIESKEVRRQSFDVKATSVDMTARTFRGLASTWSLDSGGDVIEKGAFKRTLGIWRAARRGGKPGKVIPLLDSHDRFSSVEAVLGRLGSAKETDEGLDVVFEVAPTARGDEVLKLLDGGFVDGLSIGYRPVRVRAPNDKERKRGVFRFLEEVELREVSVVVFPMQEEARVKDEGGLGASDGHAVDSDGPAPGLAPDSAERARMAAKLRDLELRRLARPHSPRTP